MTRKERYYLAGYVIVASVLLLLIILLQYLRYGVFGTSLVLGWDSPAYVWMAREIIAKGPIHMIQVWSFPHLYTQLSAFLGCLTGDNVMVERVLPIFFVLLLIYAYSRIVFEITNSIHVAGLAAILSVISINVLRLLADLHRNLMALSLSMIVLLLIPNMEERKPFMNKGYLAFVLLIFTIAITQFETYFILSLSLVLYGIFTKNPKKLFMLTLTCVFPTVVLVLSLPKFFFGYLGTLVYVEYQLSLSATILWIGGSWIILGFIIVGICLFFKSQLRNKKLVSLILCWSLVLLALISLIGTGIAHLPEDFAYRSAIILPIPVLLALAAQGFNILINRQLWAEPSLSTKKSRSIKAIFRWSLPLLIVFLLIGSSVFVSLQYADGYLTTFIPRSGYEKIMETKQFLAGRYASPPIFVFRGDPGVWFVNLYRNYLGEEIGEHFAYYGDIENLFQFVRSEPDVTYDPTLLEFEKYFINFYFNEMLGNLSGPPPPMFIHDSYITNVTELMSHPIVIITPEFYNQEIPYCIKQFHVGDGIYVIPPNSQIDFTKVSHGPEITVMRDNAPFKINSTYLHIDPKDPSIVYLSVNASHGYASYNFTNFPSNWTFYRIEQGGDISFPEVDPRRVNGTKASSGNDPADSMVDWSSPWPEQDATLEIDTSTKKEGYASLKITGKTDSWGCLSVRYDTPRAWNLAGYSSISVWARCNESALFSITLVDSYGGSRTFWAIEAGDGSATTSWKRFVVNLTDYTSQTPGFSINSVDHINLFVYSTVGKNLSFWIDDLTVDTSAALEKAIYRGRVPVDETLVAYFYTRMEDK